MFNFSHPLETLRKLHRTLKEVKEEESPSASTVTPFQRLWRTSAPSVPERREPERGASLCITKEVFFTGSFLTSWWVSMRVQDDRFDFWWFVLCSTMIIFGLITQLQGGDFTDGNGRGGESIYGEKVRPVCTYLIPSSDFIRWINLLTGAFYLVCRWELWAQARGSIPPVHGQCWSQHCKLISFNSNLSSRKFQTNKLQSMMFIEWIPIFYHHCQDTLVGR